MTRARQDSTEEFDKDPLGQILIRRGFIDDNILRAALKRQKQDDRLLGEILVEMGSLGEMDVVVALIIQCSLPYLAVDRYQIAPEILRLITREQAARWQAVPFEKVGEALSVVMANPLDKGICEQLRRQTGCKLAPFIASRGEILRAIEQGYR